MRPVLAAVAVMVALSICVFTVVKIYNTQSASPVSQLTPASASTSSTGQGPELPDLSAQTRQQLEAPPRVGGSAALPDAQASGPGSSPNGRNDESSDAKSSDGRSSEGRSFDGRAGDGRAGDGNPRSSYNGQPPGSLSHTPGAAVANPGRAPIPHSARQPSGQPGPAQRSAPAAGRVAQDPNRSETAQDPNQSETGQGPDNAAPAQSPEPVYVRPETPEERDARIRRELADSVCDSYGVQREACRARTARR